MVPLLLTLTPLLINMKARKDTFIEDRDNPPDPSEYKIREEESEEETEQVQSP